MSRCKQCNVEILDKTEKCPLCHHVLEQGDAEGENLYPDVRVAGRKYRLFENIFLFASIVVWCICFSINYAHNNATGSDFWWSLILGLLLIYANGLIRITILGKSDYLFKIISAIFLLLVILFEVDWLTGYHGWAINFAFPVSIISLDIGILILMLINRRNWQSYIIVQIGALVLSAIAVILIFTEVISFPYLAAVASAFSLFIFLGTMIIGDRTARTELKRRFHI